MMTMNLSSLKQNLDARKRARVDARDAKAKEKAAALVEREQERTERQLQGQLRREIRAVARRIRGAATNLGLCYVRRSGNKAGTISELQFGELVATPAAFYLRVKRMPYNTNTQMLEESYILQDLSLAARAPVTVHWTAAQGFWLVVERSGLGSIPRYIEYAEVLPMLPKSAGPLAFPLGLSANRKFKYADLAELPHLLIAGQTGGGKSVMLHNLICTILQRSTPNNTRFVMVDLKGGVELGVYKDVPHLLELGDAIPQRIFKKPDIVDVLDALQNESERRLQMFEHGGVRNLTRWNQMHPQSRLPRIVCVIDEIANAMLVSGIKRQIEPVIADLGAQGRAPGIHLVVSTQHPKTEVVTSLLKANLPARIAFATTSISASVVIIDSKEAYHVGPPGRHVFTAERRRAIVQAPFLSEGLVSDIIEAVQEGKNAEALLPHTISVQDIAEWCVNEDAGHFVIDKVYNQFRPQQVSHQDVRRLQAELLTSGRVVEVDGAGYKLVHGKSRQRVFVPVTGEQPRGDDGADNNDADRE